MIPLDNPIHSSNYGYQMNFTTPRGKYWAVLVAVVILAGCSGPASDRPPTYPLSGTVTYNGSPLADANLNFQLADGSGSSVAKTDAQGKYTAQTFVSGDGARPGDYKVAVTKFEKAETDPNEVPFDSEDYAPPSGDEETPPAKNLLPAKFADPSTSGLTASVSKGKNTADFELVD